ncbi:hypothetical protein GCM10011506_24870 [Marivirga lumbricoides]|uniref:Methyltransferase domain-containing protein n=1 Tax=Marivirga lumbricoides TaxID=1046115 RepID=A0ABQ1MCU9_9BACT|nr:hypothetical protein GCM10011506_24870 [Marivirga lumbricoides]
MSDFDRVAGYYDALKKLVFQGTLDKASHYFISQIPKNSSVLIVGGGSGKLLNYLHESHQVVYLEASEKMTLLAKSRNFKAEVNFITTTIESFESSDLFDVVITPFVLDCFPEEQLDKVFYKLFKLLKKDGLWLHADFYPQNYLQRKLTSLMYLFFRVNAKIEGKKAPDFGRYFQYSTFVEEKKGLFLNAMVHSYIYRKIAP